jgi:uncharacterized protein (AIM24 family)
MAIPKLLATTATNENFGGVTYHIEGELVPALHIELNAVPVYFEHHILLWKDPRVEIELKPMKGALKRMLAGMPIFMTAARGPGRIAFSRDGAGHVFALHMSPGETLDVREHQFLAATNGVEYSFSRVKGVANMMLGGTGFFIDTFTCGDAEGILWLHGYGNVFDLTLPSGEQIDIEPGGWIGNRFPKTFHGLFRQRGPDCLQSFHWPGPDCFAIHVHAIGDGGWSVKQIKNEHRSARDYFSFSTC